MLHADLPGENQPGTEMGRWLGCLSFKSRSTSTYLPGHLNCLYKINRLAVILYINALMLNNNSSLAITKRIHLCHSASIMMSFDSRFGDNITHCERAIAYSFSGKFACAEALNTAADAMACYHDGRSIRKLPKNDRLAVYGDATAQRVLCRRWYTDGYPKGTVAVSTHNYP